MWQTARAVVTAFLLCAAADAASGDEPRIDRLTLAYGTSGQDLFAELSAGRGGNIALSPYSIGTAMAMAMRGARAETLSQMRTILRHTLTDEEIDAASGALTARLKSYDTTGRSPCPEGFALADYRCEAKQAGAGCPRGSYPENDLCIAPKRRLTTAEIELANALVLTRHGETVSPDYISLLTRDYSAELFTAPDVAPINEWVKRKTKGRIDRILDELGPDSMAVLLNAVYFSAAWDSVFHGDFTKDADFNLTATRTVPVPTMQQTGDYAVKAGRGFRAIRIPYEVRTLALVVVLPDEIDGISTVAANLGGQEASNLLAGLALESPRLVELHLPRFTVASEFDLAEAFQRIGLRLAFDEHAADFGAMARDLPPDHRIVISQIRHRAVVEVVEEGTRAAAASAVEMAEIASAVQQEPPKPEIFRIDRPFLFFIADDATGAILFQGRIVDPRPRP